MNVSYEEYLPPKVFSSYSEIELVTTTTSYYLFEGKSRSDNKFYNIRALHYNSKLAQEDPQAAITLFIQELLFLSKAHPDSVIIEDFQITGKKVACVTKSCYSLDTLKKEPAIDIKKLIKDVLSETEFLLSKLGTPPPRVSLNKQRIFKIAGEEVFFVGDWGFNYENGTLKKDSFGLEAVHELGWTALEVTGIDSATLQKLKAIDDIDIHNNAIDGMIMKLDLPQHVKQTLRRMLDKVPDARPKLGDPVFIEQEESKLSSEQLKQSAAGGMKSAASKFYLSRRSSVFIMKYLLLELTPLNGKIAYCSQINNKIHITNPHEEMSSVKLLSGPQLRHGNECNKNVK